MTMETNNISWFDLTTLQFTVYSIKSYLINLIGEKLKIFLSITKRNWYRWLLSSCFVLIQFALHIDISLTKNAYVWYTHYLRTENSPKNTLALGQQYKSLFISLFFLCCEILVMCFMQINTPHKFFPEWQMAPLQGIPWNPYISWKST